MLQNHFVQWLLYLALLSFGSFVVGRMLPYRWFCPERFPYKSYPWEQEGKIYGRIGLPKWQNKLPDMSRIFSFLMPRKKMVDCSREGLSTMIRETCIAELIHLLLIVLALGGLLFWRTPLAVVLTGLYMLGNVPFVLIQRYNRPRLMRLYGKLCRKTEKSRS